MDFNLLAESCHAIQSQIDALQESERELADEILWYSGVDPRALAEDLRTKEALPQKLQSQILELDKELHENATRIAENESLVRTITEKFIEIKADIDCLKVIEKQVADMLRWYSNIDPLALAKDLNQNEVNSEKLKLAISTLEREILENSAQLGEIDSATGTLLNPFNWFARDQVDLRQRRVQLREIGNQKAEQRQSSLKGLTSTVERIANIKSDLHRYEHFQFHRHQSEAQQLKETIASKQQESAVAADDVRRSGEMLEQLRERTKKMASRRQSSAKELEDTRPRIAKLTSDLQRYRAFDISQRQAVLALIKQSLEAKRKELTVVASRKRRVDELIEPLRQEIQNLESRRHSVELDLGTAKELDSQLTSASNSYERAMVHERCERRFGVGSPRKIVGERQREVRQLERDLEKATRRMEEISANVARKIASIVVDGNNLCYEGKTFIGLAAIEAMVPLLAGISPVIVVFDSAIRRMLNMDDSGIQRRLGSHAKVHVVASRGLADETVLDLASATEDVYVLSNDRFGDFNEKRVVRDRRIIRHEIVNGNIFVHDLQLRATYVSEKQASP